MSDLPFYHNMARNPWKALHHVHKSPLFAKVLDYDDGTAFMALPQISEGRLGTSEREGKLRRFNAARSRDDESTKICLDHHPQ